MLCEIIALGKDCIGYVNKIFYSSCIKMSWISHCTGLKVLTMSFQRLLYMKEYIDKRKSASKSCLQFLCELILKSFGSPNIFSSLTRFATVWKLRLSFSFSEPRWDILIEKSGKSLNLLSNTRWNVKQKRVKVVIEMEVTTVTTLGDIQDPSKASLDTSSVASLLLPARWIGDFFCGM